MAGGDAMGTGNGGRLQPRQTRAVETAPKGYATKPTYVG